MISQERLRRLEARVTELERRLGLGTGDALHDDTSLDAIPLSGRARHCLAFYKTAGEVRRATDYELYRLPNLGRRTLKEIRDVIGYR